MSTSFITVVSLLSVFIWIAVSKEAVKPTKNINWRRMFTLISAGSLSTLILTISLFNNLPF